MIAIAILLALQAAASPPAQPPVAAQPEFQVGTATSADVIAKLGKPNSTSSLSDGTTMLMYMTNRTRVKASSFVPVVGLFASGAKAHMTMRIFTFGQDGKLKSFQSNETGTDCSGGLLGASCR